MNNAADDVQTLVIPTGHWLMEQAPDQMLAALTAFLAPTRRRTTLPCASRRLSQAGEHASAQRAGAGRARRRGRGR
jgi:hypothetical protein